MGIYRPFSGLLCSRCFSLFRIVERCDMHRVIVWQVLWDVVTPAVR